jgi:hypothetical protein
MEQENRSTIGRLAEAMFILFVVLPVCLVMEYVESTRREARFEAFQSGDFELVVLWEKQDEIENVILEAVWAQCGQRSIQILDDRELFHVECGVERLPNELPIPRYVQKYEFEGEDRFGVIYAIFAGSESLQNARAWLDSNGYSSEILLEQVRLDEDETKQVKPQQCFGGRTSQIEIAAYCWSGHFWNPRLNRWNGSEVRALHDLGDRDYVREHTAFVNWLREAAE